MDVNTADLRRLAEAADKHKVWPSIDELADDGWSSSQARLIAACDPQTVLGLLDRIATLETEREDDLYDRLEEDAIRGD